MSVLLDAANNRVLLPDSGRDSIFAVELDTGDHSIISGIGPGSDQQFGTDDDQLIGGGAAFNESSNFADAALDVDRQVLYVVDSTVGSLIAIDLASGDCVLVFGFAF